MDLPEEVEERLDQEIQQIETEQGMQYVTSIERRAIKRGEARLLRRQLTRRHGKLSPSVTQRLEKASKEEIERWADRILTAKTLDDVFK